MARWMLIVLSAGLALAGGAAFADSEEAIQVGMARIDITPPIDMKATLGGYGERMSRPASGVHDRLFAKALVVNSADKKFALVTLDALGLPPAVKPAVLEKLAGEGWKEEEILLLPSHSHTSIEMNAINPKNVFPIPNLGIYQPALFDLVVGKLVEVIRAAGSQRVDARIGTGSVLLDGEWKRNRRDGNSFIDPTLTVTRIDTLDGKPLAVLVHWATHPTFMTASDMMFSGGWPGHLQRNLEALVGNNSMVLFSNGAEGDQSPRARPDSGPSNWEKAERYGRELALQAYKAWNSIKTEPTCRMAFTLEKADLPPRCWHPDFMATGGAEYGLRENIMNAVLEEMAPASTRVAALRLGDLVMIGIPGELAAERGKNLCDQVAQKTGASHVVIGGLANEWVSYILAPEEYQRGGYEASVSFYGPKLEPTLQAAALKAAEGL